jgi:hypothetical protein
MPQDDTPDDHTAPIVTAEDDLGGSELTCELGDVICGSLHGVERDGVGRNLWGVGLAVAHHVGDDDAQAKVEKGGKLITPSEGAVGPAVDLVVVKKSAEGVAWRQEKWTYKEDGCFPVIALGGS